MIYTSRYSNKELASGNYTVVGITLGAPKFPLKYELAGNIIEIAPPGYLFRENDRAKFEPRYMAHMDSVGTEVIRALFEMYTCGGARDLALCCYEDVRKPNEWCHRLVFADWWKQRTGEEIPELKDDSKFELKRRKEVIQTGIQLRLL